MITKLTLAPWIWWLTVDSLSGHGESLANPLPKLRSPTLTPLHILLLRSHKQKHLGGCFAPFPLGIERDGGGQVGRVHPRDQRLLPSRDSGVLQSQLLQNPPRQDRRVPAHRGVTISSFSHGRQHTHYLGEFSLYSVWCYSSLLW